MLSAAPFDKPVKTLSLMGNGRLEIRYTNATCNSTAGRHSTARLSNVSFTLAKKRLCSRCNSLVAQGTVLFTLLAASNTRANPTFLEFPEYNGDFQFTSLSECHYYDVSS